MVKPRHPRAARSRTAQTRLTQEVSPGKRPMTLTRRRRAADRRYQGTVTGLGLATGRAPHATGPPRSADSRYTADQTRVRVVPQPHPVHPDITRDIAAPRHRYNTQARILGLDRRLRLVDIDTDKARPRTQRVKIEVTRHDRCLPTRSDHQAQGRPAGSTCSRTWPPRRPLPTTSRPCPASAPAWHVVGCCPPSTSSTAAHLPGPPRTSRPRTPGPCQRTAAGQPRPPAPQARRPRPGRRPHRLRLSTSLRLSRGGAAGCQWMWGPLGRSSLSRVDSRCRQAPGGSPWWRRNAAAKA